MKDTRGRQFIAMHDARGAIVTAAASLTTGTAATFLSGDASDFLDLIEATFANNSTAAATVTLANDGTTIRTIVVPAATTLAVKWDVPIKQLTKNVPWVIDMEDITGTTVTVGANFIKVNGN